jgi:hypothetical protein
MNVSVQVGGAVASEGVAVAVVVLVGSVGEREQAAEARSIKRTRRIVGAPLYPALPDGGNS